jgi:Protein of unknown function TPD sequence-motif
MFADDTTFEEHVVQFRGYIHRYGRGMVIYWYGFAASILDRLDDDKLVVVDSFPDQWIFPTGEAAGTNPPAFFQEGQRERQGSDLEGSIGLGEDPSSLDGR